MFKHKFIQLNRQKGTQFTPKSLNVGRFILTSLDIIQGGKGGFGGGGGGKGEPGTKLYVGNLPGRVGMPGFPWFFLWFFHRFSC
jgi:hypothetical protein